MIAQHYRTGQQQMHSIAMGKSSAEKAVKVHPLCARAAGLHKCNTSGVSNAKGTQFHHPATSLMLELQAVQQQSICRLPIQPTTLNFRKKPHAASSAAVRPGTQVECRLN